MKKIDDYLIYLQEDKENLDEATAAAATAAIGVAGALASQLLHWSSIYSLAKDVYENYIDRVGRKCRRLSGNAKALCVTQGKIEATKKKLYAIESKRPKCKSASCRMKMDKEITSLRSEIEALQSQMQMYRARQSQQNQYGL